MEEPGFRQRKKAAPGSANGHESGGEAKPGPAFPKVYVLLAVVVVLALYNFLTLVKNPLSQFLGAPTRHLPGVRTNYVPTFTADEAKREAVVEAFKHAWHAYEKDAMGDDEYHPISHTGSNLTEAGGIGYTVVDSIDTMIIMGLEEEYQRARTWVADKLSFERDGNFNTFETTIRVLGGLLAAYHLSGQDPVFLEKAHELGSRILPVFETESGLPLSLINLALREGVPDSDANGYISTAEASTIQLEFRYLAYLTDEDTFWEKAETVMAVLKAAAMPHGLASIFLDPKSGRFRASPIRLGSRGDSYYEYLLKQYLQTDQTELVYREMYDTAMTGIHDHLVKRGLSSQLLYIAELNPEQSQGGNIGWRLTPKQDHLVCFLGGSLMLGATTSGALVDNVSIPPQIDELTDQGKRDWLTGVELIDTCMATHDTQTGLAPEIAHFRMAGDGVDDSVAPADWYIKGARPDAPPPFDARYILRPETVESIFIAFRLTGDPKYRDLGWAIFQAIEKHCRIPTGGYASVINVDQVPVEYDDKMETFLMSETLKYLYLLFADSSVLPLNEYVFNTEAHPLPVFKPTMRTGFS
ncbi:glycoside hydrolase family 47 protein [Suillus clintonianus]|uniref:glycoside hydrolase family 47 protein n=1 Tax=Suillus clintonianus TaxID=1904413 RepID=UPI001B86B0C5|nr:glycoside hydrolase family 47 protein [Suillus clintonianus]KAG2122568.1 glycoside hydrolase family 47 protein [Suillus clintonianus]